MRHSFQKFFLTAGIMSAALIGISQPSAIAAPVKPAAVPALAPVDNNGSLGLIGSSVAGTDANVSAVCTFYTRGDYVHVSSSAFEASGHGWWDNVDCNASTATVTVQLQQYYSDGSWRNIGTVGSATVWSGGGAGNRATGRAGCTSNALTSWRSVIDVDVTGIVDDTSKLTTPTRNIYCRR